MSIRDRDPEGRARNARPRDALGRPLPHGAQGVDRIPEDAVISPEEGLRQAQQLLDDGYPFHAHEVLEGVWKSTDGERRELWKGLAQFAVGFTHLQRGNAKGAAALLRRAADRIGTYADESPHQIDIEGLAGQARSLADRIDSGGLDGLDVGEVRLRRR